MPRKDDKQAKPAKRPGAKAGAKTAAQRKAARAENLIPERGPTLQEELRSFAVARPEGWGHDDWLSFLDHLREKGHETADADTIGLSLERERLATVLGRIPGMGPRRTDALVARYDTLWSLRQAPVDELATLPGMNRALAERVRQALM